MTYKFNTNGSYNAVIFGQTQNGTWEFNNDKSVITFNPGTSDTIEWTIITLTSTELTVTQLEIDAINGKITLTFR